MTGRGRLSKHVDIRDDNWAVGSKKKLKAGTEHKMKRIFVGILDILDKERLEGNITEEVFDRVRSKTLNIGNDQVRRMRKEVDDRYNVEFIPYHVEFRVIPE